MMKLFARLWAWVRRLFQEGPRPRIERKRAPWALALRQVDPETAVWTVIDVYDECNGTTVGAELREAFLIHPMPAILAKALIDHGDGDGYFFVENIRSYLQAREEGAEADCLAFLEQMGPEMIVRSMEGTPTNEELAKALGEDEEP